MLTTVHAAHDVRIFHKEAKSLSKAGYDVTIIAPHHSDESIDGVRIIALPQRRGRLARMLLSPIELVVSALRAKARVYHFHDPELIPAGLFLRLLGRTVIYDIHEYTQDDIAQKHWVPPMARPVVSRLVGWLERRAIPRMSGVIVVNDHMAGEYRPLVKRPERVVPVYNYPDYSPGADIAGDPSREPLAAYVGVLSKDRGWETLLEATALLKARVPEARVAVIGRLLESGIQDTYRHPEGWRSRGVEHEGLIPHTEVNARLRRARIGLIPWLKHPNNERGTPQKLFEYMTAGLPVVASDLSFIGEVVRRTNCGVLVPPGDASALAAAIEQLMRDPAAAQEMGDRGRRAVLDHYSWAAQSERLLSLYAAVTQ
jgi:glycosyltransferase involved in cell wall biosynthesis